MTFSAEIDDQLTPVIKEIQEKLPKALEQGLLEAAQHAEYHLRTQIQRTAKGGPRRTGDLARSFNASIISYKGGPAGAAVSDLIYARMQDQGGTINPSSGKYLAVPIHDGSRTDWPRDRGDLHLIKSRLGNLILADQAGVPQFVLKEHVTIPPRNYVAAAHDAADPGIAEIMDGRLQTMIDGADNG